MIYLDNAATTRMYDQVIERQAGLEKNTFANPSSLHSFGMEAENIVTDTRKILANYLSCNPNEVFFTKGASESNNIVLKSFAGEDKAMITSKIEHASILDSLENLPYGEKIFLKNDSFGFVDLKDLEEKISDKTALVSIIYVNNETGTIQDIKKIGKIIKEKNPRTIYHLDATQGFGKFDIDVNKIGVDALSLSAHKIHGPKGVGALYIRKSFQDYFSPLIYGGRQEVFSSGTTNVPAIGAFGECLKLYRQRRNPSYVKELNLYFRNKVLDRIEDYKVVSPLENSSPYILDIAFAKIKSEVLLHMLEEDEIYVSSGSACSRGNGNRILEALDLDKRFMDGAIRFSFSEENTKEELDFVVEKLATNIDRIRRLM